MTKRALWQGLIAGTVGGVVMTFGKKLEQAVTGRPDSHVPARVLQRLAGMPEHPGRQPLPVSWAMHFGQAARLGVLPSVKETLSALDDADTDHPTFLPRLLKLGKDVQVHARAEERYEFIHIRRGTDVTNLALMTTAVKVAEAMVPTRPHPASSRPRRIWHGPRARRRADGPHQGRRPQDEGQGQLNRVSTAARKAENREQGRETRDDRRGSGPRVAGHGG